MNENLNNNESKNKIHPLLIATCISIILVCLIGIANMLGVLGNKDNIEQNNVETAVKEDKNKDVNTVKNKESEKIVNRTTNKVTQTTKNENKEKLYQKKHVICNSCGTVDSIELVENKGNGSGLGAVGGAVVGGLIGNQIGDGNGRTAATVVGALGGGYAGNKIEGNIRKTQSYRVRVKFEDNTYQTFTFNEPIFNVGQKVRLNDSVLEAM